MRPESIHRLTVLAEIADSGSISAAARRLGVVKSSISHHIAELEREVGAKVLHRSGRGVALTAVGAVLARHGRTIAKEAAEAIAAAKEAEAPHGTIRISMPSGIADATLIPMLAAFLARYPGIAIDAVATDQMLDLIEQRLDVAFRIGGIADGPFVARRLASDHNVFVAAPAYLARSPAIAIPADLASHPLIGFTAFGQRQSFRLEGPEGRSTEVEMTCRVTTTSSLAIKHWTLAGAGIARYPFGVVADDIKQGRLANVLPDHINPHPPLSIVYMPERFRPANVRRLIEHALEYFNDLGGRDGT
ncbi:MAG: LysR family transcriptional regulator [Hyphomicrobiaceae bacterium]